MRVGVALTVWLPLFGCVAQEEARGPVSQAQLAHEQCEAQRSADASNIAEGEKYWNRMPSGPSRDLALGGLQRMKERWAKPCPLPKEARASGGAACDRAARRLAAAGEQDRDTSIESGLCWIERNSGYRDIPAPRFWMELDEKQMRAQSHRVRGTMAAAAMYNCHEQAVYFPAGIDLKHIGPQSMLVHELVHHAQCVNHKPMGDGCDWEREAYALQANYVRFIVGVAGAKLTSADRTVLEKAATEIEDFADKACRDMGVVRSR